MDKNNEIQNLTHKLSQARNEINNIRKAVYGFKAEYQDNFRRIKDILESLQTSSEYKETFAPKLNEVHHVKSLDIAETSFYTMKPIGFIKSLHRQKNGTPRQGIISTLSRGQLKIEKNTYNNPQHSLEGLKEYSHVWLIYIFHQNKSQTSHAKVSPPRLDGEKLGIFSTRSPHRRNAVGLTLAKLDSVEGDTLMLSGIDTLDGTPIIDIKPFIPQYDTPKNENEYIVISPDVRNDSNDHVRTDSIDHIEQMNISQNEDISCTFENTTEYEKSNVEDVISKCTETDNEKILNERVLGISKDDLHNSNSSGIFIPQWIDSPPSSRLKVLFNQIAEKQIENFSSDSEDPIFRLEYLKSGVELKLAISSVLAEDPRSSYRRQKCSDRLYFFMVDSAHVTACFFDDQVEVLRVSPPDGENPHYKLI